MIIPVPQVGQHGIITDRPHDELPLNAWTSGRNIRFRKGAAEKFSGETSAFGQLLLAPEFIMPVQAGATSMWLYAGSTGVAATNGALHADISKAGGYTANPNIGWSGTQIEGLPVLTNGIESPQVWSPPGLATPLKDLPFWPAGDSTNFITALKRYLVAIDVTRDSVRYPHMIKWSHAAPTGAVPQSWDETNEKIDAGEYMLPDQGGYAVEAVAMRDGLIIYKEYETWFMQYIGGIDIFRFTRIFENIGVLSRRCAVEYFTGKHLVFTGEDVVQHDGHQAESLLSERAHDLLLANIDPNGYKYCFLARDFRNKEVLIAFPEVGQTFCTKALVWNWNVNTWGIRDLPGVSHGKEGIVVESAADESWDSDHQAWDADFSTWGERTSDPSKKRLLLSSSRDTQLIVPGVGQQFSNNNMTSFLERQGIGWPTKHGQPPDYTRMKQVTNLWPKITGTHGGVVNVSLGIQESIGSPVQWKHSCAFVIGQDTTCDFAGVESARIHALRFESDSNLSWRMSGFEVDVVDRGMYG